MRFTSSRMRWAPQGPATRWGVVVGVGAVDRRLQPDDRAEHAALELPVGEPNRFETFTDSDQGATRYPTLGEISKRVAASYFTPALWMPSKMFEAPDAAA
jgi:hypothetical protein